MSLPDFSNFDNINTLLALEAERRIREQKKAIQSVIAEHYQKYLDAKAEYLRLYELLGSLSKNSLERYCINEVVENLDEKSTLITQLASDLEEIKEALSQQNEFESIDPEIVEQTKEALGKCENAHNSERLKECFDNTVELKEATATCSSSLASVQKRTKGAARSQLRHMVDVMDSESD